MKYRFIDQEKAHHTVSLLCRVLGVTRAAYYARCRRGTPARTTHDEALREWVEYYFERSRGNYGCPRIHRDIAMELGVPVSRRRVARLMRELGIEGVSTRRPSRRPHRRSPKKGLAPDLVARRFRTNRPNRLWSADITYVATDRGWLSLAVVMDVFSRRIVGWSMSERMGAMLVVDALRMAVARRTPPPGLIYHSDQGSQYRSVVLGRTLASCGAVASMGSCGDAYDNAITETVMSTIKRELVHRETFPTKEIARLALFDYIECFYNPVRRHSSLDYLSPVDFERMMGHVDQEECLR